MKQQYSDYDLPKVGTPLVLGTMSLIAFWVVVYRIDPRGFEAFLQMLGPLRVPFLLVCYWLCYRLLEGLLRGLLMAVGLGNLAGAHGASGIAHLIRWPFTLAARGLRALGRGLFEMVWLYVRSLTLPLEVRLHALRKQLREELSLWQQYRAEFYQVYPSFTAFKRAFYGQGDEEQTGGGKESTRDPAPRAPSLEEYLALFGLTPACTAQEFEARYRLLIKQVHPDRIGPNGMATQLNEARAAVRKHKRKDWART